MEIVKGIHLLKVPIPDNPLGFLNCYLVRGRDGWLMVDTGWNTGEALATLRAGLKELGLEFTDIETIVLTHVHPDHFGLAGRLNALSPLSILNRGYSITTSEKDGRVLKEARHLEMKALIRTKLAKGEVVSRVEGIDSGS